MSEQPPKRRKCCHCKGEGHDRRNCPSLRPTQVPNSAIGAVEVQNRVVERPSGSLPGSVLRDNSTELDWNQVCYVLFDLETTGGSRTDDDIIELAAMVLGPDGIAFEDGTFDSLIRPNKEVSTFITSLTGISNDMVHTASPFAVVVVNFFEFVNGLIGNFCATTSTTIDKIILVAHNGRAFDVPFLLRSLERHHLQNLLTGNEHYGCMIDTMDVARRVFQPANRKPINNHKLGSLYR